MIEVMQATFEEMTSLREVAIKTFTDTFSTVNTPENMATFLKESYSLTNFEKEFHEVGSYLYLAWVDIQLAGFLRLRRSLEVNDKLGSNTIELHRLYVLEDFQNQKVGKVLMEKALGLAKEIMVDWIWLGVWEHNSKAQKFYTRWGFEKFGEHIFHMGDDPQTDWLLKRSM